MTDQEINIKVAELSGHKHQWFCYHCGYIDPKNVSYGEKCSDCDAPTDKTANYTSSIDVIREVVLKMSETEQIDFEHQMLKQTWDSRTEEPSIAYHKLHAKQWCIAFLKVKGAKV